MVEVATAAREDERSGPQDVGEGSAGSLRRAWVFVAVVISAHLPLFLLHLHSLWRFRPHYFFFPLLLAGIAWLLWLRWPRFSSQPRAAWWSRGLLWGGLLMLAAGVLFFSPSLAAVATVLSVGGLIGRYVVPGQGRDWLPVWLAMWLVVPPPFRWDFELVAWLQSSSVLMASRLLDVAGVRHLLDGNILVLPGQRMLADEAYGGVHALPVLLTITALFVVALRRPLLWAMVLLAASVAWAWLANVARLVTVALSQAWYQVDLTGSQSYELLGMVAILLGLALLASVDRWLAFLLRPIAARTGELPLQLTSTQNPLNRAWNWLVGARRQAASDPLIAAARQAVVVRPAGRDRRKGRRRHGEPSRPVPLPRNAGRLHDIVWLAAFGLLGSLQVASLAVSALRADVPAVVRLRQSGSMPAERCGWTLAKQEQVERKHNDQAGRFSHQGWYHCEPLTCQISINYPVPDWHDPTQCYVGNGWQQIVRRVAAGAVSDEGERGREGSWVELQLSKPTGEHGWLLFGLFDPAGNVLQPSAGRWPSVTGELARSPLGSRWLGRGQGSATETACQIQALVSTAGRLSSEQQAEVRRLFLAAWSDVLSEELPQAADEAEREP